MSEPGKFEGMENGPFPRLIINTFRDGCTGIEGNFEEWKMNLLLPAVKKRNPAGSYNTTPEELQEVVTAMDEAASKITKTIEKINSRIADELIKNKR